MSNEVKSYKFLDIKGVTTLKEEFEEVINDSEQSAKTHANSVASNAESNAKEYTDQQIASAFVWGEF